jgi:Family of unknown function (DUF6328)
MAASETEDLSLAQAVTHLLEECRMILPGLQALLGFQLIAVFSAAFEQHLSPAEQRIHLLALALLAIAGALVMTPAAYHRQTRPRQVSAHFLLLSSRLLITALVPLMFGIALDFYLITRVILGNVLLSVALAAGLVVFVAGLWFAFPQWHLRASRR